MKNKLVFNKSKKQAESRKNALKQTALLYFKEALIKQRYEQCTTFINRAKRFGAEKSEIKTVIADYLQSSTQNKYNETDVKQFGTRRF